MVLKAREANAASVLGRQLPDEVWCMVWQELPLSGRLKATHVCRSWRSIALRCPRVWSYIDFWLGHDAPSCPCPRCAPQSTLPPLPRTTAKLAHMAISRSQRLPLCVQLGDGALACSLAVWQGNNPAAAIGQFLSPQAGRIVAIHADLWSGWALPHFVSGIGMLPALQVLSGASSNANALGAPMLPPHAALLQLRDVVLMGGWAAWCGPTVHLPAVKRLRVPFTRCDTLRAFVHFCPNLAFLHVDLPRSFLADELGNIDGLRRYLDRIPHLRVSNLTGAVEMKANLLFSYQPRAVFECEYAEEPSYLGTSIFADVTAPHSFSCETNQHTIVMQAESDSMRRTLRFPYSRDPEIPPLWYSISTPTLRSLTVNCYLWPLVADPFPLTLPRLESITMVYPPAGRRRRLAYLGGDDIDDEETETRFPALRFFTACGPTEGVNMYRSSWDNVLRSVGASRPSVRCERIRVIIQDDPVRPPAKAKVTESDHLESESESSDSEDEGSESEEEEESSGSDSERSSDSAADEIESDHYDGSGASEEESPSEDDENDDDSSRARYVDVSDDEEWETTISDKQGLLSILAFSAAHWDGTAEWDDAAE
ncbi:hypothetical protein AURDEDRAFT_174825 [Auricularia subglabra TFB-10046 SS5]|nr:hypothetical protein AURDEDRAFT_174825 [Auricularia subglabra TFB-10046 SS5]